MGSNFYLQQWAFAGSADQQDYFNFYVGVISAFTAASAVVIFIRVNAQIFAGLRVGKRLHNLLIAQVFRAPINLFFDVTPIGKILNRFSKDMAVIDEDIYYSFGGLCVCTWQILATLAVTSIAVPLILAVIAAFMVMAILLFVYTMKAYKDCYRVEAVTMSPILSFF